MCVYCRCSATTKGVVDIGGRVLARVCAEPNFVTDRNPGTHRARMSVCHRGCGNGNRIPVLHDSRLNVCQCVCVCCLRFLNGTIYSYTKSGLVFPHILPTRLWDLCARNFPFAVSLAPTILTFPPALKVTDLWTGYSSGNSTKETLQTGMYLTRLVLIHCSSL